MTLGLHRIPEADCVRVALNDGLYAIVDAASRDLIAGYRWRVLRGHNGKLYAYAKRTYMHRLVAGTPPGFETDHINGDGLDNRRANLRTATRSQNKANMGKPARPDGRPHTSRFKGVSWAKSRGWRAAITVDQHSRYLGIYAVEEDAARAYDAAAIEAWGEFAATNFTDGSTA